jgi:hypothetical protein
MGFVGGSNVDELPFFAYPCTVGEGGLFVCLPLYLETNTHDSQYSEEANVPQFSESRPK